MRILGLFLFLAAAVFAQSAPQASPAPAPKTPAAPLRVDKALRSRIQIFYRAHVDGKPRLADRVVAADSKDFFFEIPKPRFFSFEILKLEYSNKFTRATATVNCGEEVAMMGLGKMKVKMPRISTWKLEGGQWVWYFDQKAPQDTPFGKMVPGGQGGGAGPFQMPKGPTPEELTGKVNADKTLVKLTAPPSSDTITIKNGMPGWVKVLLERPRIETPGLELTLDRADIQGGQTAKLLIRYDPKGQKPTQPSVNLNVVVEPVGTLIPIRIVFPAEPPK
jgi:hypothetical protein